MKTRFDGGCNDRSIGLARWLCVSFLLAALLSGGCNHRFSPIEPVSRSGPSAQSVEVYGNSIQAVALNTRDASQASHLFDRLSADRTGIEFVHQWSPPSKHEMNLANAVAGGGVAIADYNGDGLPDIYLTGQSANRLYRNRGDFRFEDVTEAAGLDHSFWGTGCSFVDIDDDGDLDLFVCGYACPNRMYVNQGNGTFVEQAKAIGLDFNGASIVMAFADYDRDGDLDAYLLTNRLDPAEPVKARVVRRDGKWWVPEKIRQYQDVLEKPDGSPHPIAAGQYDHLYRNDGPNSDGRVTFSDVSQQAGIHGNHYGLSATWWDVDNDGFPDLYVANDFFGPDQLYHNNGDGTFTDVARFALPHTPWFSMGSDAADVNNDGRLDFLATDMSGTNHYKQKVSMGEMGENSWFLSSAIPRQYMRNAFYLNTGTGRFMEAAYLVGVADTNWTWSVNFADFDNDGWIDLFISNGMTRDWFNSDLRNASREKGKSWQDSRALWLNSPKLRERNLAFQNQGEIRFQDVSSSWGLDYEGVSFGAALGDLDGDGDLDLVVNNFEEPVSVYRNGGAQGHRVKIRLRGVLSNRFGIDARVRITSASGSQVRYLTLSRGFMSAGEPLVHFGLGIDELIQQLTIHWPSGHVQRLTDLPVDRFYTISEPAESPPTRSLPQRPSTMFRRYQQMPLRQHREQPHDDFAGQPLLPNKLSQLGPGMAWGDVDGDGDEDLYVGGAAGQPGTLIVSEGNKFRELEIKAFAEDRACEDLAAVFLDADRDGDLDLYVVSGGVESFDNSSLLHDRLYQNNGAGGFSRFPSGTLPSAADSGGVAAAADFDRDGDLDLFVGGRVVPGEYPTSPESRLLRNKSTRNGECRFTDATDEMAPNLRAGGMVTSALWSDVDDDGWLDLLVTYEWGPVRLYQNSAGKLVDRTQQANLAERTGWWNGIAGRDIDNDGDIDFVVSNFGLNTKYRATQEKPVVLYYGDFDASGQRRLVEAEFERDILYPIRGKSCSTHAIPLLGERFKTFHDFASASLADIYTPLCLERAQRFEINTLESGVLVNDGQGRFTFDLLSRLAQVAPGFGVVSSELDGDGLADLYIVQNFFSPQPETGRMDGGVSLLLKGTDQLDATRFEPIWPDRSGLVVAGDAKSVTVADLDTDGWMDLIVGINNGQLLAFRNQGSPTHRPLTVRLQGPAGNPSAIGSRVIVTLADGSRQTAEVYGGGGYLSQSTAALAFGLGASQHVQSIRVRWPDGTETVHQADPSSQSLLLRKVCR